MWKRDRPKNRKGDSIAFVRENHRRILDDESEGFGSAVDVDDDDRFEGLEGTLEMDLSTN